MFNEPASQEQRNLLNAACGDLAKQIEWHGARLSKDEWRHLISGTILGWRIVPGIDRGEGPAGLVMLGRSSLDLDKTDCSAAITQAFLIGDDPSTQGLGCPPIKWSKAVCAARWIVNEPNTGKGRT